MTLIHNVPILKRNDKRESNFFLAKTVYYTMQNLAYYFIFKLLNISIETDGCRNFLKISDVCISIMIMLKYKKIPRLSYV